MIRLQGGSYSNEGRVEVYCNGQWGTICDDGFSSTEAKLICKQLGYTDFVDYNHLNRSAYTIIITAFSFFRPGSSSQPIWLDELHCNSNDTNCINSCQQCPSVELHDCLHTEDVTIECSKFTLSI